MSEFSDFLKHKQAYVAIGEFKPGRFSEARQLYEQAVSTYQESGFKGAYLLQQPGTDCGIAIILWDDIGNMEDHRDEAYQAILKEISGLFVRPPEIKFYEVCSEIGLSSLAMAMN
ncbi:MAG: antibiotic biosynthesis monooxygenase [Leptolyngbya sp. SIO4C1]|nr:antibiotic biosynthesis monooxygenase [Leptolyngbya sp. SIO4C1]